VEKEEDQQPTNQVEQGDDVVKAVTDDVESSSHNTDSIESLANAERGTGASDASMPSPSSSSMTLTHRRPFSNEE